MGSKRPTPAGLKPFWKDTVEDLVQLKPATFTEAEKERHRIFSLLLLGLIYDKWNGNRYGPVGDYGVWREGQELGKAATGEKVYDGGSYLGHNIAALAVDGEGRIIDFDFNHNQVFESTVEHAESRLVRRVFALNELYDPWYALDRDSSTPSSTEGELHAKRPAARRSSFLTWSSPDPDTTNGARTEMKPTAPAPYASLLSDVTIYTSLESCAQCSGIMCLSSVKDIVYLQWDQGQFLVGNIMRKVTKRQKFGFVAPRPIRGDEFGFRYFGALNSAYDEFKNDVKSKPFYDGPGLSGGPTSSPAITSFLCTDRARKIFGEAAQELAVLEVKHARFKNGVDSGLTNQQILVQARDFLNWASQLAGRGAPHRV